ncbi:response regulator, partial [Pontibacterium sp.]|uniref:response regulator n=1 Tax=Pontibacterium sp. TaxID=2036026 RepID=UPI0035137BC0
MDYSGFTVMLVDDEESILKSLTRLLRPLKCDVVAFSSPVAAIEAMSGTQADLVISDMRMPEMGGEVLLETVADRWPDTERVVMTGYADMQATIDAINRGKVSRFLSKPWNDDELLEVVRKSFELASLRRENAELQALTERKNQELEQLNASLEQKVQERTVQLRAANDGLKSSYRSIVRMFSTLTARRMGVQASEQNQMLNLILLGVAKACQVEGNQL